MDKGASDQRSLRGVDWVRWLTSELLVAFMPSFQLQLESVTPLDEALPGSLALLSNRQKDFGG